MGQFRTFLECHAPIVFDLWRSVYWRVKAASRKFLRWQRLVKWNTQRMLARPVRLGGELTIGVATYVDRYDRWFRKLLKDLRQCVPDVQIVVAVNGFHDRQRHEAYLNALREDWKNTSNVRFVLHHSPSGLTRLWNEIMALSGTDHVLIMNDDLSVRPLLAQWLSDRGWEKHAFCTINHSWSHFVISKRCYEAVGPFDEGFEGIGFEDFDYLARMRLAGIDIGDLECPFIMHDCAAAGETSFDEISASMWGKYSVINHDYFLSKWKTGDANGAVLFVSQLDTHVKGLHPEFAAFRPMRAAAWRGLSGEEPKAFPMFLDAE